MDKNIKPKTAEDKHYATLNRIREAGYAISAPTTAEMAHMGKTHHKKEKGL